MYSVTKEKLTREGRHDGPKITNDHITPRQMQVLELMARGFEDKEICRLLQLSYGTVKNHATGIRKALKTDHRVDTVLRAIELGLIFKEENKNNQSLICKCPKCNTKILLNLTAPQEFGIV